MAKKFKFLLEDDTAVSLSSADDISISSDETMEDLMDKAVAETLICQSKVTEIQEFPGRQFIKGRDCSSGESLLRHLFTK